MQGSIATSCEERYNVTDPDYSGNQTIIQYERCIAEGFPSWYYAVFMTPLGVAITLGIKKLAII